MGCSATSSTGSSKTTLASGFIMLWNEIMLSMSRNSEISWATQHTAILLMLSSPLVESSSVPIRQSNEASRWLQYSIEDVNDSFQPNLNWMRDKRIGFGRITWKKNGKLLKLLKRKRWENLTWSLHDKLSKIISDYYISTYTTCDYFSARLSSAVHININLPSKRSNLWGQPTQRVVLQFIKFYL